MINDYISCLSTKSANFKEHDIYSFGCIVYSFFSHKGLEQLKVFSSGNRKDPLEFLNELDDTEPDMPVIVKEIIRACWEEDFLDRPLFFDICNLFIEYLKEESDF